MLPIKVMAQKRLGIAVFDPSVYLSHKKVLNLRGGISLRPGGLGFLKFFRDFNYPPLLPDPRLLSDHVGPVRTISACAVAGPVRRFDVVQVKLEVRPHVDRLHVVRFP